MRPEIKRLIARGEASRAAKIVNHQGGNPNLGEAQRKFFVELVQTSHIGKDENLGLARTFRMGDIRGEAVAIRRLEHNIFSMSRASVPRWIWRNGLIVVTHRFFSPSNCVASIACFLSCHTCHQTEKS